MIVTRTVSYEGTSVLMGQCGLVVKHTCSVWEMILEEVVHLPEQHVVGIHCRAYYKDYDLYLKLTPAPCSLL